METNAVEQMTPAGEVLNMLRSGDYEVELFDGTVINGLVFLDVFGAENLSGLGDLGANLLDKLKMFVKKAIHKPLMFLPYLGLAAGVGLFGGKAASLVKGSIMKAVKAAKVVLKPDNIAAISQLTQNAIELTGAKVSPEEQEAAIQYAGELAAAMQAIESIKTGTPLPQTNLVKTVSSWLPYIAILVLLYLLFRKND